MSEIINKVANSTLEVFDLEDYYQTEVRIQIDLSQWLEEGFMLIEKKFRAHLKNHNWQQYQNNYVTLFCSTDAILPAWAAILVTTYLTPFAKKTVVGSFTDLETAIYHDILDTVDFSVYANKSVILKGCSKKQVPENAYIIAIQKLQKHAKSIMYGEACSAVPLFKKS
ncbi:MAG: hypothetical protein RLZZ312_1762 [Bacteroidota bacterium]|jgi:hypothetical protein